MRNQNRFGELKKTAEHNTKKMRNGPFHRPFASDEMLRNVVDHVLFMLVLYGVPLVHTQCPPAIRVSRDVYAMSIIKIALHGQASPEDAGV